MTCSRIIPFRSQTQNVVNILHRLEADSEEGLKIESNLITALDLISVGSGGEPLFLKSIHNKIRVDAFQFLRRVH